ncbi:hypothetical protein [Amycolatopsis sp. YIM 10]|uniref:hypothetical protein n=1 Tax=Amycolatopsis sp. YIM 10 TaxID=2653857 RepID=UPI00128FE058|nr:hypothetical protein [Amycolatopsis sp. YIM 10]
MAWHHGTPDRRHPGGGHSATQLFRPEATTRPIERITGDCNAQGNNNDLTCSYKVLPPAPRSIGDVEIGWAGYATFFFDGNPDELPKPPDYPTHEVRSHCDERDEWLSTDRRVYTMQPQVWMSMLSGQNDQVVVTRVEPTVFSKRPVDNSFTVLQCLYGADGVPGSLVTVDVATGKTHLVDQSGEDPSPKAMPPAALVLNGAGYGGAIVRVECELPLRRSHRGDGKDQRRGTKDRIRHAGPAVSVGWRPTGDLPDDAGRHEIRLEPEDRAVGGESEAR